MTGEAFMRELEYLLQDVQDEEKDEALQYYRDYFDEAGPENEEQVIREFGSPERIAAIVRSDISGHLEDGGEFTESGYQDERFKDPNYQVAKHYDLPEAGPEPVRHKGEEQARRGGTPRTNRTLKIVLMVILVLIAAPVLWSIGEGLWGLAGCVLALFLVFLLILGIATICCLIAGVVLLPWGIAQMFGSFWSGALMFGAGAACFGLGLLGLALSLLFYGRFVPFLIRSIADCLNRLLHRGRRG